MNNAVVEITGKLLSVKNLPKNKINLELLLYDDSVACTVVSSLEFDINKYQPGLYLRIQGPINDSEYSPQGKLLSVEFSNYEITHYCSNNNRNDELDFYDDFHIVGRVTEITKADEETMKLIAQTEDEFFTIYILNEHFKKYNPALYEKYYFNCKLTYTAYSKVENEHAISNLKIYALHIKTI